MKSTTIAPLFLLGLLVAIAPATANQEASNIAHTQSGSWGRCCAESLPDDHWGDAGSI